MTKTKQASKTPAPTADYHTMRETALFNLKFMAASIAEIKGALTGLMTANLLEAGAKSSGPFEVDVSYNAYSPRGNGIGFLQVEVATNWAETLKGAGNQWFGFKDLTKGLPQYDYATTCTQGPLRSCGERLSFSLPLDKEENQPLMFIATLNQERTLAKALDALRASVELSGVSRAMQGNGADKDVLAAEAAIQEEVLELERQLEDKRQELENATRKANDVRTRLRNAETPAVQQLVLQLDALRAKIGIPPSKKLPGLKAA